MYYFLRGKHDQFNPFLQLYIIVEHIFDYSKHIKHQIPEKEAI